MDFGRVIGWGKGGVLLIAGVVAFSTTSAWAQPGGMRGGFNSPLALLGNPKVQEELELVDDQLEEVQGLQDEMGTAMRELFQSMRDSGGDRQQMFEQMREKMTDLSKDFEADLEEILLPEQLKRLKQLNVQMQARGRGGAGTGLLDNEDLKRELDITSDQEEKMREAAEKAQEMVREETAKIQKKALDQVLSVLSSEQRKKYEEMVGDSFDFGGFGGFGRGGRGGPGGQGGPGGGPGGGRRGGNGPDF
ncbi:MAG: hypothetical protein R3C03_02435 [Pirellulaceae bacterium]